MDSKSELLTLDELERQELLERREQEEIEDLGAIFKRKILDNNGIFSETLQIDSRGRLGWQDPEGKLVSLFSHKAIADTEKVDQGNGIESLFKLAKKVNNRFPELRFNFEQNPERTQVKYTVSNAQQSVK